MCGACGILGGGSEWLDPADVPGGANGRSEATRLAERHRRIALVNRLLEASRTRLSEQGRQLIVRGPTGRTSLVTDLAHVWRAAELVGRAEIDPLDEGFLVRLETGR